MYPAKVAAVNDNGLYFVLCCQKYFLSLLTYISAIAKTQVKSWSEVFVMFAVCASVISDTYTVLFFDGLLKTLKPQSIKVLRPDLKKRVNVASLCVFNLAVNINCYFVIFVGIVIIIIVLRWDIGALHIG